MLDIAMADSGIACWDAKYTYNFWRPITAIANADTDGNANTQADTTWTPLLPTPAFPEYMSGHSTFSGAADAVLSSFFGASTAFTATSVTLPGVTRAYSSFAQAADEAGISRIYGGLHFMTSDLDGLAAGRSIGNLVLEFFTTADTQPPRITVVSPQPNLAAKANVTVTGRVTDSVSGVAKLEAQLDNGAFTAAALDAQGNFNVATTLSLNGSADGAHAVHLCATDRLGNVSTITTVPFTLDTLAPSLTVTSISQNGSLSADTHLAGTLGGTGTPLTTLTYQFDSGAVMPAAFQPFGPTAAASMPPWTSAAWPPGPTCCTSRPWTPPATAARPA